MASNSLRGHGGQRDNDLQRSCFYNDAMIPPTNLVSIAYLLPKVCLPSSLLVASRKGAKLRERGLKGDLSDDDLQCAPHSVLNPEG